MTLTCVAHEDQAILNEKWHSTARFSSVWSKHPTENVLENHSRDSTKYHPRFQFEIALQNLSSPRFEKTYGELKRTFL